jgi:hypothetical protein
MYKAVGISGCEPPQPQQFGRKVNSLLDLNRVCDSRLLNAATNFADHFQRTLNAARPLMAADSKLLRRLDVPVDGSWTGIERRSLEVAKGRNTSTERPPCQRVSFHLAEPVVEPMATAPVERDEVLEFVLVPRESVGE